MKNTIPRSERAWGRARVHECIDDCIKAENLLLTVWVLGVSAYPDRGIHIRGKLEAEEREGVFSLSEDDLAEDTSSYDEIKSGIWEIILKSKDLVRDARFFKVGLLKAKSQDFNFRLSDFRRKLGRGAFYLNTDFFSRDDSGLVSEPVPYSTTHLYIERNLN